jgi:tetratricopeptide (TPR) repeat protein
MEDYYRSSRTFDELIRAFPNSNRIEEARYYKARCRLEEENYDEARIILSDLINNAKKSISGKAALSLADISRRQENWESVLKEASRVIELGPNREDRFRAMMLKGEALYNLERYQECADVMTELLESSLEPKTEFRTRLYLARSLSKLGNIEESFEYLEFMQGKGKFIEYASRIGFEIGYIYEINDNDEQAIQTYRNVAADFPDSSSAKEAWYRTGKILMEDLSRAEEAQEAFDNVEKGNARITAPWVDEAKVISTQIDSMFSKQDAIDDADDPERRAQLRFQLAELYRFSLNHPEWALEQYRKILDEAPETDYAARSLYFVNLYELNESGEYTEEEDERIMREVVEKYPDKQFTEELKVYLGEIEKPLHIKAFTEAEIARTAGEGPEVYMPMYEEIIERFPQTEEAYRARFAMAYYYEHDVGDREKALEIYEKLAEEEPAVYNEKYIELAEDKLDFIEDEDKLLEESKRIIADIDAGGGEFLNALTGRETGTNGEDELSGFRKIRARNERIRSRYYSN